MPCCFRKAFDSITHTHARSFPQLLCLPNYMIDLILNLFQAPIVLLIQGHVCKDKCFYPRSGVRQGCPLFPTLFAIMISPLAFKLHEASPLVTVLLYADDLLIIIKCPPAEAVVVILLAMQVLQLFTDHSRLHINHSKSALLLKGLWTDVQISHLISTKLPIVERHKYLGVFFGHVNEDTSYEPAFQTALGRAFAMQSRALSFPERVMLLKLCILPQLVFPARVVFPTDSAISTLKIVYNVALCLTSWDLTHNILALPRNEGGYSLPQPKTFLGWQHSAMFQQYVKDPLLLPASVTASLKRFALLHGMSLGMVDLPFFQMGSNVVKRNMRYLAWSARAFSLVRQPILAYHDIILSYDTPLWHNNCSATNMHKPISAPNSYEPGCSPWDGF